MRRTATFVIAVSLLACVPDTVEYSEFGSDSGSDEAVCAVGSLDCACTDGAGCEPGLECVAGVCSEPPPNDETGACTMLGCDCDDPSGCDDGLICLAGACVPDNCGDAKLDPGEACDDGNQIEGDGCDNDCSHTEILDIAAGGVHTCAVIEGGRVRCWGANALGQLGYGNNANVGDDEHPAAAGDLPLPAAVALAAGGAHTCGLFEDMNVRCWGANALGQLGYGNSAMLPALGDDESIEGLAAVNLIASVNEVDVGVVQTCVRVAGQLRCWGDGAYGQLGLASITDVGDNELPLDVPAVMLGGEPVVLGIGGAHGCAIMASGGARCWGRNDFGQLGYMMNAHVGDNEHPSTLGELDIRPASVSPNATLVDLGAGLNHSCVLFSTGEVLCWGANDNGQLGQGNNENWGDQAGESPAALKPIDLGGFATAIAVGYQHTCALVDGGAVRCWGDGGSGQLGNGSSADVGLTDVPADSEPIELGAGAIRITAGGAHTCVVLEEHEVMCWGDNEFGQLGYGVAEDLGDDELPITAGTIELL